MADHVTGFSKPRAKLDEDECERQPASQADCAASDESPGSDAEDQDISRDAESKTKNQGHDMDCDTYSHSSSCASVESSFPPLNLNYSALKHIARYCLPWNHGRVLDITELPSGSYHEIRVLLFEDGWRCLARFKRSRQHLLYSESEYATMEFVRRHTTIPVPEVYFVNYDPEHVVGSEFCLMEYLPGKSLAVHGCYTMPIEHKKTILEQIADVMVKLSSLKFDVVGSISSTGIGPCQDRDYGEASQGRGPFATFEDYMYDMMDVDEEVTEEVVVLRQQIKAEVAKLFHEQDHRLVDAPFRLMHGDFDTQNILFDWSDPEQPPKLTGVIDWDGSLTWPLYYTFKYPIFIQDCQWFRELWEDNKDLRKLFVKTVSNKFPKHSQDRSDARACFRKTHLLNNFFRLFPRYPHDAEHQAGMMRDLLEDLEDGELRPYQGSGSRYDWEPDSEEESDD